MDERTEEYLTDFIEANQLGWKNDALCNNSGRPKDIIKAYKDYGKDLPGGTMKLEFRPFKTYLKRNCKDMTPKKVVVDQSLPDVETEYDLVMQCFEKHKIKHSATGEEITMDRQSISAIDCQSMLLKHVVDYNRESQYLDDMTGKMKKIRRTYAIGDVEKVLAGSLTLRDHTNRDALKEALVYNSEHEDYTTETLRAVLEAFRPVNSPKWDIEFHILMLKQMMWQVKQHIMPLYEGEIWVDTVPDYILINISSDSGEGAGKSFFWRKLYSPIADYSYESALDKITSSADFAIFSKNYIVLFDELNFGTIPAAERGKLMSALKNMLTTKNLFARIFHTQKHQRMKRQFTAISTSNGTLTSHIYDPTGMRRFYEITVNHLRDPKRLSLINGMDSLKLWQGIDEDMNDRQGYVVKDTPNFRKLQRIQKGYVKTDAIDVYLLESALEEAANPLELYKVADADTKTLLAKYNELPKKVSQTVVEKELGIIFLSLKELRDRLIEFYKEDKSTQSFLPVRDKLKSDLKTKGYWIIHHNNADLIPVVNPRANKKVMDKYANTNESDNPFD